MQCNYNRRQKKDDQTLPNMQQVYTEQLIADDSIVFKGHNHPNDLNKLQGAHQEEYELSFGHIDAVQCSCNGSKMYDQRLPNIGQEEAHSELFRDVYNTGGRLRKSLTLSLHELEPLSTQSKNNGTITTSLPMNTPSTEETIPLPHLHKQKTILSTDWQTCELIDNQGCILQLRNSDVITTFPPGVLSGVSSDYCYKTVHNNIERLAAVLGLPVDTIITSPAPEYHMQTSFADFVEVKVPHRMPKNFKEIKVHSFSKHCNGDKVDLVEVPRYETKQEAGDKMDMFFVINSSSVLIYTKHFSGFVCTTCQGFIEYNLSASIYGRKGVIDNCTDTLDVMLYLKGAKSTITDFEVTMEDKIDKRFHHLETERVKLLERHQQRKGGQLQFRFGLLSNSVHNWIHRKYNNNDQFQHSLLLVDPETLMRDCEKHIIHSPNTKWYLQRNGETNENCDFYIEVVHKEKQPSALDEMSFVKTSIPASENFAVASGLPQRENTATIPGAITDIALTLKENLNQEECLKLIKHLGCLQYIPPASDSRQRNDFRYDYWYSAFIQCYNRLQDNFITRVLDGLTKMDKTRLVTLVRVHSPSNNIRVASVSPIHRPPAVQDDDRHLIAQPSSAEGDKSD
ncbi:uncharacterized protein LOC132545463 [Ylistrum balloti]|uniref:uncharacterized protein LOC132545463 n=1 Tax=Ylistrum balloti TaxID=509963 RepID=UPI0029058FB0|nr:uncharacterized protein LOC132545463 [Ylistrum balloti]